MSMRIHFTPPGVSRFIADLDGTESIGRPHLAEALAYRALHDRLAIAA